MGLRWLIAAACVAAVVAAEKCATYSYFVVDNSILATTEDAITYKDLSEEECRAVCTKNRDQFDREISCASFVYDHVSFTCTVQKTAAKPGGEGSLVAAVGKRYFEKICLPERIAHCQSSQFIRADDAVLIGFAANVTLVDNIADCVQECVKQPACKSAMFFYEEGECITNTESALSKPRSFAKEDSEKVIYFQNGCTAEPVATVDGKTSMPAKSVEKKGSEEKSGEEKNAETSTATSTEATTSTETASETESTKAPKHKKTKKIKKTKKVVVVSEEKKESAEKKSEEPEEKDVEATTEAVEQEVTTVKPKKSKKSKKPVEIKTPEKTEETTEQAPEQAPETEATTEVPETTTEKAKKNKKSKKTIKAEKVVSEEKLEVKSAEDEKTVKSEEKEASVEKKEKSEEEDKLSEENKSEEKKEVVTSESVSEEISEETTEGSGQVSSSKDNESTTETVAVTTEDEDADEEDSEETASTEKTAEEKTVETKEEKKQVDEKSENKTEKKESEEGSGSEEEEDSEEEEEEEDKPEKLTSVSTEKKLEEKNEIFTEATEATTKAAEKSTSAMVDSEEEDEEYEEEESDADRKKIEESIKYKNHPRNFGAKTHKATAKIDKSKLGTPIVPVKPSEKEDEELLSEETPAPSTEASTETEESEETSTETSTEKIVDEPVNYFSEWGDWTPCEKSGERRIRRRKCLDLRRCLGALMQVEQCPAVVPTQSAPIEHSMESVRSLVPAPTTRDEFNGGVPSKVPGHFIRDEQAQAPASVWSDWQGTCQEFASGQPCTDGHMIGFESRECVASDPAECEGPFFRYCTLPC